VRQQDGALEFMFCQAVEVVRARVETRELPNDWQLQTDVSIELTIDEGEVVPYSTFTSNQEETIDLKPDEEIVISVVGPDVTQTAHFVWPGDPGEAWVTVDGKTSLTPCRRR
jgi:hypothetical protein